MFYDRRSPIRPRRDFDFNLVRTNLVEWLRTWKMVVPFDYEYKVDLMKFAQKTKAEFENMVQYEIKNLKSVKTQFALNVKFFITRNGEKEEMNHYFRQRDPAIFNKNNVATVSEVLRRAIDEFKGQIEAWSQRGSGWVVEAILDAYVNVARYQPFRGGSYFPLPAKLKNKKGIININININRILQDFWGFYR